MERLAQEEEPTDGVGGTSCFDTDFSDSLFSS